MIVVTICYKEGIDTDYYLEHHVTRSEELMQPLGLLGAETRTLLESLEGSKPTYSVITSLYFPSIDVFQECMAHPALDELREDTVNFYTGMPEIFVGKVVLERSY